VTKLPGGAGYSWAESAGEFRRQAIVTARVAAGRRRNGTEPRTTAWRRLLPLLCALPRPGAGTATVGSSFIPSPSLRDLSGALLSLGGCCPQPIPVPRGLKCRYDVRVAPMWRELLGRLGRECHSIRSSLQQIGR
jgi:hypothetical protein